MSSGSKSQPVSARSSKIAGGSPRGSAAKRSKYYKEQPPVEKFQKEKVPSDWFNAFMTQDDTVEEKDSEHKRAIENHMARIKEVEDKTAIFFSDAVNSLSYQEYEKLMQDPEVRDKIAQTLVQ